MHVVADTTTLVADGIITSNQAEVLKQRSRQVMVGLAGSLACMQIESILIFDDGPFGISEHLHERKRIE